MSYKKESSMGTVALIFGILGCIGIIPCLGSLVAIIAGHAGKNTTDESNAKVGRILGWIGCLLYFAGAIIFVILIFVIGLFGWVQTGP
jgi:hypothetical protein